MQLPTLFTDPALGMPALYEGRGALHPVIFEQNGSLLPLLRRSCPFVTFDAVPAHQPKTQPGSRQGPRKPQAENGKPRPKTASPGRKRPGA